MNRTDVLGVGFDDLGVDGAVKEALELIDSRSAAYVVTPNPEIVMLARSDGRLRDVLNRAALVLPDGIGVVKGAGILGTPLRYGKLPGIDFAAELMARLAERKCSVYLFGSKPGVAETAAERLVELHPGLVVAGVSDGYFADDAPIIDKINAAAPDLLLVCLGAPKQEFWMAEHAGKLSVGLMAGLGGSLDLFAGNVKRAPEGWRRLGLEWLYRLIKEPKRIGRMLKLPLFVFAALAQRLKGKRNG